ncbi:nucleotidyltransferase domain-containing protein [Turneriella parva]|uniref:DNA polymerase beta domain protein region n=1 Tax=Turneriella parva (strain ATCC BAA-1111 / DSM 21527 / NCTC 11395 / H) TaxID=869212 RepID=I4B309_TURPD|nr:nucleotidyltransferase domain-containing protein [Turneriella parva]AFM11666.1 DNA polymerase beta domain protein region [Turneriella parva DSM 21527]
MSTIVFPTFKDPLNGLSLEDFTSKLREMLTDRVHSAWLYGSVARGEARPDSDVDLFIVTDTDLPFHERGALFDDLRDFNANIEPLVYTPAEWLHLTSDPTVGFWQSAVREMVKLL